LVHLFMALRPPDIKDPFALGESPAGKIHRLSYPNSDPLQIPRKASPAEPLSRARRASAPRTASDYTRVRRAERSVRITSAPSYVVECGSRCCCRSGPVSFAARHTAGPNYSGKGAPADIASCFPVDERQRGGGLILRSWQLSLMELFSTVLMQLAGSKPTTRDLGRDCGRIILPQVRQPMVGARCSATSTRTRESSVDLVHNRLANFGVDFRALPQWRHSTGRCYTATSTRSGGWTVTSMENSPNDQLGTRSKVATVVWR
jgi:hypothetical protein